MTLRDRHEQPDRMGCAHLFAVFLIVAASGAPISFRFFSVRARAYAAGAAALSVLTADHIARQRLAVLVLDLGRPDRLIVAMTHYNFKSIFAWNIFLYTGFFAIVAAQYLWR